MAIFGLLRPEHLTDAAAPGQCPEMEYIAKRFIQRVLLEASLLLPLGVPPTRAPAMLLAFLGLGGGGAEEVNWPQTTGDSFAKY